MRESGKGNKREIKEGNNRKNMKGKGGKIERETKGNRQGK